ncbi:tetratricopeptide repeat protein [Candidatus Haliotispira prima]|uniref:Tetratricopeptide repeat protein n=1 Tax=Candidatus Haliotispira prima TaxID=3034016 RepID=A0ABY8MJY0_9SPIO|nr:tetratricopeptide repeat protein [Candidatus Haliotispira prima]
MPNRVTLTPEKLNELLEKYELQAPEQGTIENYTQFIEDIEQNYEQDSFAQEKLSLAYRNLGNVCHRKGDIDCAIVNYDQAIKYKPDDAEGYNSRGLVYGAKGHIDLAIADFNQAIRLNLDNAKIYNNRGISYGLKGDVDLAIVDFNQAIKLKKDYAEAYYNRGAMYGEKGSFDLAIVDYNEAIRLDPDYASAYNNRGNVHNAKGAIDLAIADYNEAIRLNSDHAGAYNNRGAMYGVKGDVDLAIADFNEAIRLNPEDAKAYTNRGAVHRRKGDIDLAIADYNEAIRLNPDFAGAYHNRGVLYEKLGKFTEALRDYNRLVLLMPGVPGFQELRDRIEAKVRRAEDFSPVKVRKLRVQKFLHLDKPELEFTGLNLFIGKNGTGKSHLLQLLYSALQDTEGGAGERGMSLPEDARFTVGLQNYDQSFEITEKQRSVGGQSFQGVYIAPKEVLGIYKAVLARPNEYETIYQDTARLLIQTPPPSHQQSQEQTELLDCFHAHYQGRESVERAENSLPGKEFRYKTRTGEYIPLDQGAEGTKKIQQLKLLLENGSITRDSVLFMDEPEANLHPAYVRQLVQILVALAAKGVQIFMASHSYTVLKELAGASKRAGQKALCLPLLFREDGSVFCRSESLENGIPDNEILKEILNMDDDYDEAMFDD